MLLLTKVVDFVNYSDNYFYQRGGHIDEALYAARAHGITELAQRAEQMQQGLEAINNAGWLGKVFVFIKYADVGIARRVFENYTPGITFNSEGLAYFLMGAMTGFLLYECSLEAMKLSFAYWKRKRSIK